MLRHYTAALVAMFAVAACSAGGGNNGTEQNGSSFGAAPPAYPGAPPFGVPPGTAPSGAGGTVVFGPGVMGTAGNGLMERIDPKCVDEVHQGELMPLDIYVMFDVSGSMSCPADFTGQIDLC